MTTSKPPNLLRGSIPWPIHPTPSRTDSGHHPTATQLPLFPAETEDQRSALLHHAHNAQGLLAHRDPELLRRFVLDSMDAAIQNRRQVDLFVHSTTRLAIGTHAPSTDAPRHQRIVQTGLYAWPVAICMAQNLKVRSHFHFDVPQSIGLKAELLQVWASSFGLAGHDVCLHGIVDVRHLAGVTPLALQSFMRKSIQCSRRRANPLTDKGESRGTTAADGDPWALLVSPKAELLTSIGPNTPVSFLLTAFVSWDCDAPPPVWCDPDGRTALRLASLLEALFTHTLPSRNGQPDSEMQARIRSDVRLGHPQPLHEAMTQAQWMQLAWMAERARKTDCSFRLDHHQDTGILTWSASLSDESESELARVTYCYDGFWRPASHVQTVIDQVSLAQATGQMRTDPSKHSLTH